MKRFTLLKTMLLLCALIVGSGSAWALDILKSKSEGFETKTAGESYQSTVTVNSTESDCGVGWEIFYGTVSTSSKIAGANSAALRLYNDNDNYGYIKTTTPIEGLSGISFKAKASTSNSSSILVDISYSTDGSTWTLLKDSEDKDCEAVLFSSSATTYSYNIPTGGKYFKIEINSTSTKPSKKNTQLTIDDVTFSYIEDVPNVIFYEGLTSYSSSSDAGMLVDSPNLDTDVWNSFTNISAGKVLAGDANGHIMFGKDAKVSSMVTKSLNIKGNAKLTFKVQRYDSSNYGPLNISVSGATATGDTEANAESGSAVWTNKEVNITGAAGDVVLTFASGTKRIRVDDILLVQEEVPVTISAAGWATYCSEYALDFTNVTGLTAYTASKEGTAVKFTKVTGKVPANTGLLVGGTTTNVPVCASADPVENLLEGVTEATVKDAESIYVLMKGDKGLGFYKNTNAFTVRANSAYLPAASVAASRSFISFDDETTGIEAINSNPETVKENAREYYNLNGQRVTTPTKGLYIVNGKKVIINK